MVPEAQVPPLTYDVSELVIPSVAKVVEPVPSLDGETIVDDELEPHQAFEGGLIKLSLLPRVFRIFRSEGKF